MENTLQVKDEKIRDAILLALHKAYRVQRGKYLHMSQMTIWQEARGTVDCSREDIKREIEYLEVKNWIVLKTEKIPATTIGRFKRPAITSSYYKLSSKGIDLFEVPGKYSTKDVGWKTNIFNVNVSNSTIQGSVAIGAGDINITTTYNTGTDIEKVISLINARQDIEENDKETLRLLINSELREILENPDAKKTKGFLEKVKNTGKLWLVPVITQMAASYFLHLLGVPPEQTELIRNTWLV